MKYALILALLITSSIAYASDAQLLDDIKRSHILPKLDQKDLSNYGSTNQHNDALVKEYKEKNGIKKSLKISCPAGQVLGAAIERAFYKVNDFSLLGNPEQPFPLEVIDGKEWKLIILHIDADIEKFHPNHSSALQKLRFISLRIDADLHQEIMSCYYALGEFDIADVKIRRMYDASPFKIQEGTCKMFDSTGRQLPLTEYMSDPSLESTTYLSLDIKDPTNLTDKIEAICEQQ